MKVSVLTISDRCSKGESQDISGKLLCDILKSNSFDIVNYDIVADELDLIKKKLTHYCDNLKVDFIITTGGTGLSPRDVTPEATLKIADKLIPGISEFIRLEGLKHTKKAILSRAVSVIRKNTIIINLPGSPKAVKQSMDVLLDILPHALDMLKGEGH
jgi:molybdenum cofactor synthesis domain-containing protein